MILTDKVLARAYYSDKTSSKSFIHSVVAKELKISEEDIVFAIHNIDKYVQIVEKLCSVQRYARGCPKLYRFNKALTDKFIERGGFEAYFKFLAQNKPAPPPPPIPPSNKYKKTIIAILIGLLVTVTGGLIILYFTKLFDI